jgi:hypothetical protein
MTTLPQRLRRAGAGNCQWRKFLADTTGFATPLGMVTALLPLYVMLELINPTRGLHDRIAGTYLMPE